VARPTRNRQRGHDYMTEGEKGAHRGEVRGEGYDAEDCVAACLRSFQRHGRETRSWPLARSRAIAASLIATAERHCDEGDV
jgi:hypothetical protein